MFHALHELRNRFASALTAAPLYHEWLAAGSPSEKAFLSVGEEEAGLISIVTSGEAKVYVTQSQLPPGVRILGYRVVRSGQPSGVTAHFDLW